MANERTQGTDCGAWISGRKIDPVTIELTTGCSKSCELFPQPESTQAISPVYARLSDEDVNRSAQRNLPQVKNICRRTDPGIKITRSN